MKIKISRVEWDMMKVGGMGYSPRFPVMVKGMLLDKLLQKRPELLEELNKIVEEEQARKNVNPNPANPASPKS